MTMPVSLRRIAAAGLVAALSFALSACFVLPGKFAEALDIRKDGHFTYSYKGEVVVLGLTKLMDMANAAKMGPPAEFEPEPCYSKKTGKVRPCTKAELDEQKQAWDEEQAAAAEAAKQQQQTQAAMLGGIDPNDPKAGEELAERLRKQVGWKSVTYKGDGVYEVDFQISGMLDRDFSFPTIEKLPALIPFITINARNDATLRITTPIMDESTGAGTKNMGMGMFGAAMEAQKQGDKDGEGKEAAPPFPVLDGTFTLTTDAEVLANNTEDGPQTDPAGKRLVWKLNARNPAAPTALLKLGK